MKVISRLISGLLLAVVCLAGCQDDDIVSMTVPETPDVPAVTRAVNTTSSLVQDSEGYWTATKRVPLVGRGRIVDNFSPALVSALSGTSGLGNIVNTDLTDAAEFGGGLADVGLLGNQLLSVRDMNYTYAGGQTVGFVYKVSDPGLLEANVLKGFWIKTFLNGVEQELKGGKTEGELLELNLISIGENDGKQEISFTTSTDKPFDEVQIGVYGISADLLSKLSIYYAYVGDNPIKPAVQGGLYYPESAIHENGWLDLGWTSIRESGNVVSNSLTDYAWFGTLSELLDDPCVTVNLGKDIPAGSEVGFVTSSVDILSIDLGGGVELNGYNADDTEVASYSVTNVLGVSAVKGGNSMFSMMLDEDVEDCSQLRIIFHGLSVSLSSTHIYYAYTKDPVTVDASSYFAASDVTITGNSYLLPTPSGGTTSWYVARAVEGTTPSISTENGITKVINMSKDGDYVLTGTYTPENGENSITISFTITRESLTMEDECDQMIGSAEGASIAEGGLSGNGGALVSIITAVEDLDNIVDGDANNFATCTMVAQIAEHSLLAPIVLKNKINTEHKEIKVGFTLQNAWDFLSADVLDFFLIRLYNGNEKVADSEVDKSSAVNASLIGSQGNKFRIGITTDKEFDRIELWTAGVLSLGISQFRIYNAYWEDAEADCPTGGMVEACMELLTTAHGAAINYDETGSEGLANVASYYEGLGNLLDDDKETHAIIGNVGTVLGNTSVSVTFDDMVGRRQIGFIIKAPDYVADLDALSATVLTVYNNGEEVASTATGGVLGLDLIGYSDRTYVETDIPEGTTFDEVRIMFPSTLSLLKKIELYGVYIRRDSDSDGIPDCAEDDENPSTPSEIITDVTPKNEHVCQPESIVLKVEGGMVDNTYKLICRNFFKNNEQTVKEAVLDENYHLTFDGLEAGDYYIEITDSKGATLYNGVHVYVHPLETTWKTDPVDGDWNNWQNWSDGAPWTCTNVIIPGNCADYPELVKGGENNCANLHLGAGAELVNAQYLKHYDLAWVELSLAPNMYYMLSAPLKSMVTGDFFVPQKWAGDHSKEDYFTRLTPMTAPESRFTPRVYQRFWSSEVPGKVMSEGALQTNVIVSETDWTAPFNAVAEPYAAGMGFSVRTDGAATFRFPKTHTEYTYFDGSGSSTGLTEGVARQDVGRLVIDGMQDELKLTVENHTAGTTFVVGNPFLAHIDIQQFLAANSNISSVKLSDGQAVSSIMRDNSTASGYTHIAPMQAFYVEAKTAGTTLEVTFTAAMQAAMPGYNIYATSAASSRTKTSSRAMTRGGMGMGNTLRLTAECDGRQSTALVTLRSSADDAYRAGEDSKVLIDTDMQPAVVVFTTADGHALDIQQRRSDTAIPVGFRMQKSGRVSLTLSHDEGDVWSRWSLVDSRTGRRYPLSEGTTYVDLGTQGTHAGRFCLEKN